jgi:hypothetical protein
MTSYRIALFKLNLFFFCVSRMEVYTIQSYVWLTFLTSNYNDYLHYVELIDIQTYFPMTTYWLKERVTDTNTSYGVWMKVQRVRVDSHPFERDHPNPLNLHPDPVWCIGVRYSFFKSICSHWEICLNVNQFNIV